MHLREGGKEGGIPWLPWVAVMDWMWQQAHSPGITVMQYQHSAPSAGMAHGQIQGTDRRGESPSQGGISNEPAQTWFVLPLLEFPGPAGKPQIPGGAAQARISGWLPEQGPAATQHSPDHSTQSIVLPKQPLTSAHFHAMKRGLEGPRDWKVPLQWLKQMSLLRSQKGPAAGAESDALLPSSSAEAVAAPQSPS